MPRDQEDLSEQDLVPLIGSEEAVRDVLARKRALTMPMAQAIHEDLGIPADVLLRRAVVA